MTSGGLTKLLDQHDVFGTICLASRRMKELRAVSKSIQAIVDHHMTPPSAKEGYGVSYSGTVFSNSRQIWSIQQRVKALEQLIPMPAAVARLVTYVHLNSVPLYLYDHPRLLELKEMRIRSYFKNCLISRVTISFSYAPSQGSAWVDLTRSLVVSQMHNIKEVEILSYGNRCDIAQEEEACLLFTLDTLADKLESLTFFHWAVPHSAQLNFGTLLSGPRTPVNLKTLAVTMVIPDFMHMTIIPAMPLLRCLKTLIVESLAIAPQYMGKFWDSIGSLHSLESLEMDRVPLQSCDEYQLGLGCAMHSALLATKKLSSLKLEDCFCYTDPGDIWKADVKIIIPLLSELATPSIFVKFQIPRRNSCHHEMPGLVARLLPEPNRADHIFAWH